jgi:outer membrane lipoprotein carrier protein
MAPMPYAPPVESAVRRSMTKLLILLTLISTATSQTPTASALAHKVDAHYNHLQSLTARFTERYQGMGLDRTETGTLTLRKPGRMRWAYDAPSGKLFVLDSKSAISYTPGDVQAQRTPAKQIDDLRSPLSFLLGHTQLTKELGNLTLTLVNGGYSLSGAPKGMQQSVHTIALTVDPAGQIQSMRIEQVDGATTSFIFTDIHENVPTPDSDFIFTPPPGVTIVNGTAPI